MKQSVLQHVTSGQAVARRTHQFYIGTALVLLLIMVVGFQQFYFHGKAFPGRPLTPPIRTLVIVHAVAMTAWMLLFLVQPVLVATGRVVYHMRLGLGGVVLAAVAVVTGVQLGIGAARVNPPELVLWGLVPSEFMAIPVLSILLFAVFVLIGILNRRRSEIHRPMMLLAVLAILGAAVDRIPVVTALYHETALGHVFGPFTGALVLGLVLVLIKTGFTGSRDRWLEAGFGFLALCCALIMKLARSDAWDGLAVILLG